ncbi:MAG: hypothetical protein M9890_06020 [Thermomicrobiales bacterium]|nr:hypothetical protein [Thermomicrobiales bacterium]
MSAAGRKWPPPDSTPPHRIRSPLNNAGDEPLIERKGARTALLTTRGFRDILELAREQLYDIYDLFAPPPEPLIDRPLRLEINERVDANGTVLITPDQQSIDAAVSTLRAANVESVAVVFLHAYQNRTMSAQSPRSAPLCRTSRSRSSDIAPIAGEYERTSTTAADAFTKPLVQRWLSASWSSRSPNPVSRPRST